MSAYSTFSTAGGHPIEALAEMVEEEDMRSDGSEYPGMAGSIKEGSGVSIGRKDRNKVFEYAMDIYNQFCDIMNNGLTDEYNRQWDLAHPGYIIKSLDSGADDPYYKGYFKVCGMVLKNLAEKMYRRRGYYILLDEEEPCTIAGDFSEFWINVKKFRKH